MAYVVCQHFGIDTSEYSFGYVATWSSGKDARELKASLETIRQTDFRYHRPSPTAADEPWSPSGPDLPVGEKAPGARAVSGQSWEERQERCKETRR